MLHSALVIVMVVCAVLMTVLMLLQSEKGGGLRAFDGTKAEGIEGVTSPLRTMTVLTAGAFLIFAVALNLVGRM